MHKIKSYILAFIAFAFSALLLLFIYFSFYPYHTSYASHCYYFYVNPYLTYILIGMSIIHIAINRVAARPEWGYSKRALSFFWFSRLFVVVGTLLELLGEVIFNDTHYNT